MAGRLLWWFGACSCESVSVCFGVGVAGQAAVSWGDPSSSGNPRDHRQEEVSIWRICQRLA